MKDILLECIECGDCYIGDNKSDGCCCPRCGGKIIPLGYIEKHKEYIDVTKRRLKSAMRNGNIRVAVNSEQLKANYVGGVDYGKRKDITVEVKIKLDTEELQNDIKEINNKLQETIEKFKREGIKVVM